MRRPTPTLVMDTNILLGIALGRGNAQRNLFERVLIDRCVLISERTREEAEKVAADLSARQPGVDLAIRLLLPLALIIDADYYAPFMADAGECLRLAVSSRNGSVSDAHILALAWMSGADIWSGDRDFAGTGWASWSSANLSIALERASAP